jgi:hypothetical protein
MLGTWGELLASKGHDIVDALGTGSLLRGIILVLSPPPTPVLGENLNPSLGGGIGMTSFLFLKASSGLPGWLASSRWPVMILGDASTSGMSRV